MKNVSTDLFVFVFRLFQIKKPSIQITIGMKALLGGFDQIRTGVEGFADLCLATRPRNPDLGLQSYKISANNKAKK